jgi:hypothetical protein
LLGAEGQMPLSWVSTADSEPSFLSSTSHLFCSTLKSDGEN